MLACIYSKKLCIRVCLLTSLKSPPYYDLLYEWIRRIILLQWPGTLRKLGGKHLTNVSINGYLSSGNSCFKAAGA